MTTTQCRTFCRRSLPSSASSYVKGRAVLHCILAYGVRQEWCDTNPVAKIEVPKVQEKSIEPLAPAQVETLKKVAQRPEFRDMRLSLSLMLYGGIRPVEVSRLRSGILTGKSGRLSYDRRPARRKAGVLYRCGEVMACGRMSASFLGIGNANGGRCVMPQVLTGGNRMHAAFWKAAGGSGCF